MSLAAMSGAEDGDASLRSLEGLYRQRYRRFLRLALAIVGSREAAADVVQEAFARAIRSRHEFRGEGSLEAWVWRTVLNVARTHNQRERTVVSLDRLGDVAASNGHAPWPELRVAVAVLPERQRHTLFLRHYAGLSYEEIAEVLGIARGTVSATLHQAHATLRRSLKEVPR